MAVPIPTSCRAFTTMAPRLAKALDAARSLRLRAMLTDVCGIPGMRSSLASRVFLQRRRAVESADHGTGARQVRLLRECIFDSRCTGFWRKYVELYGTGEFAPVRERGRSGRAAPSAAPAGLAAPDCCRISGCGSAVASIDARKGAGAHDHAVFVLNRQIGMPTSWPTKSVEADADAELYLLEYNYLDSAKTASCLSALAELRAARQPRLLEKDAAARRSRACTRRAPP